MFGANRKSSDSNSTLKLPRLGASPAIMDLQSQFSNARDNRGRDVELSWHDQLISRTYALCCLCRQQGTEPVWTIYEDPDTEPKICWQSETSDYNLIIDAITMLSRRAVETARTSTSNSDTPGFDQGVYEPATAAQQRPISSGYIPPHSPAAQQDASQKPGASNRANVDLTEGDLSQVGVPQLLQAYQMAILTGKLEIINDNAVGYIFFHQGNPVHAGTPAEYGDTAIRELVGWEEGIYRFLPDVSTSMRSVEKRLPNIVAEGIQLLDQKRLLKKSGLTYESLLLRKHKDLSETEFKLMLTKGAPLDYALQKEIYDYLAHNRTLTDLLRDRPLEYTLWNTLLYNFLSCGLIEVKEPDTVRGTALEFLGEAKEQVETLASSFVRTETGIYSFEAFLFFLQYEYYRYEAYGFPLSIIVFEMKKKRQDPTMEVYDQLPPQAAAMAAMRIDLIKRPLDTLAHFEALDHVILLPNTKPSQAAFIANRIYENLTATPLDPEIDSGKLFLALGIASLPSDGEDLSHLLHAARDAKLRATQGSFPIVLSRTAKP
jgi:hypothetical protein